MPEIIGKTSNSKGQFNVIGKTGRGSRTPAKRAALKAASNSAARAETKPATAPPTKQTGRFKLAFLLQSPIFQRVAAASLASAVAALFYRKAAQSIGAPQREASGASTASPKKIRVISARKARGLAASALDKGPRTVAKKPVDAPARKRKKRSDAGVKRGRRNGPQIALRNTGASATIPEKASPAAIPIGAGSPDLRPSNAHSALDLKSHPS